MRTVVKGVRVVSMYLCERQARVCESKQERDMESYVQHLMMVHDRAQTRAWSVKSIMLSRFWGASVAFR